MVGPDLPCGPSTASVNRGRSASASAPRSPSRIASAAPPAARAPTATPTRFSIVRRERAGERPAPGSGAGIPRRAARCRYALQRDATLPSVYTRQRTCGMPPHRAGSGRPCLHDSHTPQRTPRTPRHTHDTVPVRVARRGSSPGSRPRTRLRNRGRGGYRSASCRCPFRRDTRPNTSRTPRDTRRTLRCTRGTAHCCRAGKSLGKL